MTTDAAAPATHEAIPATISRRLVFYVHGFDPRGAERPYATFVEVFDKYTTLNRVAGAVGPLEDGEGGHPWLKRWQAMVGEGDGVVETDFEYLGWQDLIPLQRQDFFKITGSAIVTGFEILRKGVFVKMVGVARSHAAFAVYPFVLLWIYLIAMAAAVYGGFALGRLAGPLHAIHGTALGVAVAALIYQLTRKLEPYTYAWFALRLWNFMRQQGSGKLKALDARFDEIAGYALARLADRRYDEVVLVALSHGAYASIDLLGAMLSRDPAFRKTGRGLTFLALGAAPSMTAWFGPTKRHVAAVRAILATASIQWLHIIIRKDLLADKRYDPVADLGLEAEGFDRARIVRHTIVLDRMFMPETHAKFRGGYFLQHLQYLAASETGEEHDYFAILCGPRPVVRAAAEWRNRALESRRRRG